MCQQEYFMNSQILPAMSTNCYSTERQNVQIKVPQEVNGVLVHSDTCTHKSALAKPNKERISPTVAIGPINGRLGMFLKLMMLCSG